MGRVLVELLFFNAISVPGGSGTTNGASLGRSGAQWMVLARPKKVGVDIQETFFGAK